ncbi:MAG: protein phosphatase 2C domain-containing protein, partial [Prevotellaceae bacterium]|nr:protein phosphatase 2C domain-containing protein [Prevotellaceae bacterium]
YENPLYALNEALQFANMQILGYAAEHPELKGMGTTACILLLQGNEAYIAHVGDSRIYLYLGKEKQLHRITKDHSFVQTLVDAGQISDEDAEHHPNKNRILRALGIKPELEPTFSEKPILPKNGDIFLICSDGLSGMIDDTAIEGVLSSNTALRQKGEMLINLALENGGLDNITVELIQISDSTHKKTVFNHCDFNPKGRPQSTVPGSKNLMKIVKWVAVAIVVLAVGFGVSSYLNNKAVNENLKTLCDNLQNANDAYKNIEKEFQSDSTEYCKTVKKTEEAKKESEKNPTNQDLKNAYEELKKIDNGKKNKLENLKNERDTAKQKADSLKKIVHHR